MAGEKNPLQNSSVTTVTGKVNLQIAFIHHMLTRSLVSACHMFKSSLLFNQLSEVCFVVFGFLKYAR